MTKLIFCYQFDTPESANEFIMRLYYYYILTKRELPIIDLSRLSYNQAIVESFPDSEDNMRLLEVMNLLATECDAYIKSAGPKLEKNAPFRRPK